MKIFHTKKLLFALFLPGIFLGFLYVELIAKDFAADIGIFGASLIRQYSAAEFAHKEFLLYLLPVRLIPFVILLCLMFTNLRKGACIAAQMWTGFTFGALLTATGIRSGIFGATLCIVGLFPHFLMYIPAYIVVIWYGYTFPTNRWNVQKSIFVFITIMTGIFLEAFVTPPLMRIFLKIFKLI